MRCGLGTCTSGRCTTGTATADRQRLGIVRFPPEPEFWTSVELTTRDALGPDLYETVFVAGAALRACW